MYRFHYGFIKQKYGENVKLLYTDTDSFIYKIKTKNLYDDMESNMDYFDFSNYDPSNRLYNTRHKQVIGFFKDELAGKIMHNFIALAPKLYAYQYSEANAIQTNIAAKGFPKATIKSHVKYDTFEKALHEYTANPLPVTSIRSVAHEMRTLTTTRNGFCCFDVKRFILADNVHSLPHGHYAFFRERSSQAVSKDYKFLHTLNKRKRMTMILRDDVEDED